MSALPFLSGAQPTESTTLNHSFADARSSAELVFGIEWERVYLFKITVEFCVDVTM